MVAVESITFDETTDRLEAEVCTLAAQIAAATSRFVLAVAELDRREAWAESGCRSMAHWLSWKCGLGVVAARAHVRVGRALEDLPVTRAEFAAGRLSFSKVRAITRVAKAGTESQLVEFAQAATASQLEAAIRGYERTRVDSEAAQAQLAVRRFRVAHADDGSGTALVKMPRDTFELVLAALDAASEEVPHDPDDSAESRRVDALEVLARSFLAGNADREPTEVVVHVDEDEFANIDDAPVLARLTCDAAIRTPGGRRRTRTIPIALRRAIEHRDQHCCRFPGCTNRRRLHVHHIVHFIRGGPTDQANCILLCPYHHRAVHEGGWRVHGDARQHGQLIFLNPRGRRSHEVIEPTTPSRTLQSVPDLDQFDATRIATAIGESMDLAAAIDALCDMLGQEPD